MTEPLGSSSCANCYPDGDMELTQLQARTLERLQALGFQIVAFDLYPNYLGVRKGNCAALLARVMPEAFAIYGAPTWLVRDNFGVRVKHNDGEWFVWKKERVEATPERVAELERFSGELADALLPTI
jgi:hypothetical protein